MRYAIVSDIHANLQAWNAVLIDIRSRNIDRILCLGDIIGYGPSPTETLRSVYTNVHDFVLGNHDAVFCGKLDGNLFNDHARRLLEWTAKRLNRQAVNFFRGLPLSLAGPGFRCAHGDFAAPAQFDYIIEPSDALRSWGTVPDPVLFVGHTHRPGIFVVGASGTPHLLPPQDFVIEPGKRFLVNAGSVGQSRDGDVRACYLVYDDREQAVFWHRIPFDLDAFRVALDQAGLDENDAAFLTQDPRLRNRPLREQLGFNPPDSPADGVRDTVNVRDIEIWKHRAGIWRRRCLVMASIGLAGGISTAGLYWHYGNPVREIRGPELPVIHAGAMTDTNLLPPLNSATPQGMPDGWSVRLGNRWRQSVRIETDNAGAAFLRLCSSTDRASLTLSSVPVRVDAGQRFQLRAMIRKQDDFKGSVAIVIGVHKDADNRNEILPRFAVQEPTLRRSDGWELAQRTITLPAGTELMHYRIDGLFKGTIEIREPELIRR